MNHRDHLAADSQGAAVIDLVVRRFEEEPAHPGAVEELINSAIAEDRLVAAGKGIEDVAAVQIETAQTFTGNVVDPGGKRIAGRPLAEDGIEGGPVRIVVRVAA